MKKDWKLTKEQQKAAIKSIKRYFAEERQEEIGELAAILLLDQITPILAASFYNQGIQDSIERAQAHMEELYVLEVPLP